MSIDLTPFMQPAPAPGPSQNVGFRQGTIVAFDPVTLANTVDVGGAKLANLPLLGVSEAASLVPGAVVGLHTMESTLGTTTYAIVGRLVIPGSPAAAAAVSLLSSATRSATVSAAESTASTSYTDLTTVGPTLTDVSIGPSGRCLVTVGAEIQVSATAGATNQTGAGLMSFKVSEVSGPSTAPITTISVPAVDSRAAQAWIAYDNGATNFVTSINGRAGVSRTTMLEGLNPGVHTFTASYRKGTAGSANPSFVERNLTVISL